MGAPEKRAEAKRAQTHALRALLRDFAVRFARLNRERADALITQAFTDEQFTQLNRAFHERAFTVFLNE
jgi:hypothetical protein